MSKTANASPEAASQPARKKKRRWLRWIGIIFVVLIALVACARPMMPWAVRWYVNQVLSRNLEYRGRIGPVTLNLWRGAYSIANVRISKRMGNVPVPLIEIKELELAVQWNAILHGKIVGQVVLYQPQLNFVA